MLDALVHGSDLTDEEIRDQVKSLIGAGYNTTASSLAWMLWETISTLLCGPGSVPRPTGVAGTGSTEGVDDRRSPRSS